MSSCPMQDLVMARGDGRLADKEAASVERHLQTCRSCVALCEDLDELAELGRVAGEIPEPSPPEHRRRRLAVLRAAVAEGTELGRQAAIQNKDVLVVEKRPYWIRRIHWVPCFRLLVSQSVGKQTGAKR